MAAPSASSRSWTCPGCGKLYRIPLGKKAPALCPACRTAPDSAAAEPSAFDQLSAVVQADAEKEPLPSRVEKTTVAERPAVQLEPSPFERLFAAVESRENNGVPEPRDSRNPVPSAETSRETREPVVIRKSRGRMTGQWRVVAVVGTASLLLAGWGLYGVLSQTPGGTPGEVEVWKQAQTEVAEHLLAPKSAEFPKPGEIRRVRDSEIPRWSVKAVVDASNERGVPIRHHWLMEISFDPQPRRWETAWLEIDGDRVYASEATIREERERTIRTAKLETTRDREHAGQALRKRSPPAVNQRIPDGPSPPADAATTVESDADRETRRAVGRWREVATFEGASRHRTSRFQVGPGSWRFRWVCDGDAKIQLLDAAGKPIGDEIEIYAGERGTQFVARGRGEYALQITTDAQWMLIVEE